MRLTSPGPSADRSRCTTRAVRSRPVCVAAVVVALVAACGRHPRDTALAIPGHGGRGLRAAVTHVVDGDTVELAFAGGRLERARLLGVDTPETVKPDAPVQCYGPEASARTKDLLAPGTVVLVQRDAEARDRYGRLLVYLWRQSDGLFVNASLVGDGYARTLSIAPNTAHRVDLSAAAANARTVGVGLWGNCSSEGEREGPGP